MRQSPLVEFDRQAGGTLSEYRGALVRADGGETAVLPPAWPPEQTLVYDASWRAVLAVEGPEARQWLNGMISANVRDLAPGRHTPSFQLDPKGHVLAMLDVACVAPDAFLLLCDEAQREELEARLRRYVFIAKLRIEDRSATWGALRLRGGGAGEVLTRAGLERPPLEAGASAPLALPDGMTATVLVSHPGLVPQLELVVPAASVPALWERFGTVALPAGSAVEEHERILSREPRYGIDITVSELPQETGQLDRLDFSKGCYIGQEIVERIRARGAVHRHWSGFRLGAAVPAGEAVEVEGKAVGKLTSVAARGSEWFGLGYIRDPHQVPGTAIIAGGVSGEVEA